MNDTDQPQARWLDEIPQGRLAVIRLPVADLITVIETTDRAWKSERARASSYKAQRKNSLAESHREHAAALRALHKRVRDALSDAEVQTAP